MSIFSIFKQKCDRNVEERLSNLDRKFDYLISLLEKHMPTLQQILDSVNAQTNLIDGVSQLITDLQAQLTEALADQSLPADVQAQIDAVFQAAEANKEKLAAALVANTPQAPAPVPAPATDSPL